jgi:hypothetical protein
MRKTLVVFRVAFFVLRRNTWPLNMVHGPIERMGFIEG